MNIAAYLRGEDHEFDKSAFTAMLSRFLNLESRC